VLGTAVSLDVPEPVRTELRAALDDFAPGPEPQRRLALEPESDGSFRLFDDERLVRAGIAQSVAAATVVWRLNHIAAGSLRHLVIHAGCVVDDRAVVLPGRSGAGKSTLVAACVTAGLSYLSDEYAVVDLDAGSIVPYPKPLGLDGERLVAASQLRRGSVGGSRPVGGIVFPRYVAGAPTSVTTLTPALALTALASHSTNLARLGGAALPWLAGIAASCPAWQITYGDATEAVEHVRAATRPAGASPRPAEVIGPITSSTTTVALGDDLVVFDELTGNIHVLNESAAFVWMCLPEAPEPSEVAEVALTRAPPGSMDRSTISAIVDRLVAAGLVPEHDAGPARGSRN
jgi:hypothetical protein